MCDAEMSLGITLRVKCQPFFTDIVLSGFIVKKNICFFPKEFQIFYNLTSNALSKTLN